MRETRVQSRSARRSTRAARLLAIAALAAPAIVLGGLGNPALAAPEEVTIYSSMPATQPISTPSMAFETWGINEYGSVIALGGTERELGRVEIGFVSWACEDGYYYRTSTDRCVTTPASGFTHPITANIYAENGDGTLGSRLGTVTQNVFVPYRPSADTVNCLPQGNDARFYDAASGTCHWGLYFVVSFDFSSLNLTLPDRVIVTAAFNTSTAGYAPLGQPAPGEEDGFDLLNMAIFGEGPSVGEFVDGIVIAWNTPADQLADPEAWDDEAYQPKVALYSKADAVDPEPIQPTPPDMVDTGARAFGSIHR